MHQNSHDSQNEHKLIVSIHTIYLSLYLCLENIHGVFNELIK